MLTSILTTILSKLSLKTILIVLAVVALLFGLNDYIKDKQKLIDEKANYERTVEAYEQTIQIIETTTKEKAVAKEQKQTVKKAIDKLNKLKKVTKDVEVIDNNYTKFIF